jgi:16S rRNA (guanine527-N7)-methyltransferase
VKSPAAGWSFAQNEVVTGPEARLRALLAEARAQGFLGPADLDDHIRHGVAFAEVVEVQLGRPPSGFADLGTGGGPPGLVLAARWASAGVKGAFVESSVRRCAFLRSALDALALTDRISVWEGRAETIAHDPTCREAFEVVTARSLAAPAVTAELAAGFVEVGGLVVVSEPPLGGERRWAKDGLAKLGLGEATEVVRNERHFVAFEKQCELDDRFPRPSGRPAKRPLW